MKTVFPCKFPIPAFVLALLLAIGNRGQGATLTSASYDGSYSPASASPPAGQSTWTVVTTGGLAITPNNDNGTSSSGVANFNDTLTTGRIQVNQAFTAANTPFSSTQANDLWTFSVTLKLGSTGASSATNASAFSIGLRDEYNGTSDGKTILLGFYLDDNSSVAGNQSGVGFTDANTNNTGSLFGTFNPFDDTFHTYTVTEFIDGNGTELAVSIDGVSYGTWAYSARSDATASGNGFGYFGNTTGTADVTIDSMSFQMVPEPPVSALFVGAAILFLLFGWRRIESRWSSR